MAQSFWRVRLGEAVGYKGNEKVFDKCKNEKPPCVAVGWGELDLSIDIREIAIDYKIKYEEDFGGNDRVQIKRWVNMKKGDFIVVMMVPATICAIGKIIHERYHNKEDEGFIIDIVGGPGHTKEHPYGKVCFFNRIDVEWITNPDNYVTIKSLSLPKDLEAKLKIPLTIIELDSDNYNILKNKIDMFEPEEDLSSPKYGRTYDIDGRAGR